MMKKVLWTIFTLLLSAPLLAQGVLPEHSGAWYNWRQSGHGLSIEVISPDRAVAFWYTFDTQGKPVWLYIDGPTAGNVIHGEAFILDGMVWGEFDPGTRNMQSWGTVDIEFTECDRANLTWDSVFPEYGRGEMPLWRLTRIFGVYCYEKPSVVSGYYDVVHTETASGKSYQGKAIIDPKGFMTAVFDDPEWTDYRHMHGNVTVQANEDQEYVGKAAIDAELHVSPAMPHENLNLKGTYESAPWPEIRVESEDNAFQFRMNGERLGAGPVSYERLAGEWSLRFAGPTYPVTIGADGAFEWSVTGLHGVVFDYKANLVVSPDGIPTMQAGLRWGMNSNPQESSMGGDVMRGNAVFYVDPTRTSEHLEIRFMDAGFYFLLRLQRPAS